MAAYPQVVVFDVFETLFSMKSLVPRLGELGLPPEALPMWYGRTLRDGFALAAANAYAPMQDVAQAALEVILADHGKPATGVEKVMAGLSELAAETDVEPAFQLLDAQNVRIFLLSNGSQANTLALLQKAGLDVYVEKIISVDDIQCWKPRREIYLHVATAADVEPAHIALVAAHAWDVQGAMRAGLTGGWVKREELMYSPAMQAPDVQGNTLVETCQGLLELPHAPTAS